MTFLLLCGFIIHVSASFMNIHDIIKELICNLISDSSTIKLNIYAWVITITIFNDHIYIFSSIEIMSTASFVEYLWQKKAVDGYFYDLIAIH